MSITLEEIERLREKADVSYEEARAALERSSGDLLEALTWSGRERSAPPGREAPTAPAPAPPAHPPPRSGTEPRARPAGMDRRQRKREPGPRSKNCCGPG